MKNPILEVRFFKTETNNEPVRDWLQLQTDKDKNELAKILKPFNLAGLLVCPLQDTLKVEFGKFAASSVEVL
jgi:hypothetical protein